MSKHFYLIILVFSFWVTTLSGCASRSTPAPVAEVVTTINAGKSDKYAISNNEYEVKKGETLYSIAWRADTDVRTLAAINNLAPPYKIYPGQSLSLKKSSAAKTTSTSGTKLQKSPSKGSGSTTKQTHKKTVAPVKKQEYVKTTPAQKTYKNKELKKSNQQVGESFSTKVRKWVWPSNGKIIRRFSLKPQGTKGIDFGGVRGADVRAAADGKVVYAGNALRGYGNLIIVKHNDDYLSAYAHNDKLLVKEQQNVQAGQVISKMGDSGADRVMLHFEIRFRGKSVNPAKYLPK